MVTLPVSSPSEGGGLVTIKLLAHVMVSNLSKGGGLVTVRMTISVKLINFWIAKIHIVEGRGVNRRV